MSKWVIGCGGRNGKRRLTHKSKRSSSSRDDRDWMREMTVPTTAAHCRKEKGCVACMGWMDIRMDIRMDGDW